MKNLVSLMAILFLVYSCKKEVLQSGTVFSDKDIAGTWQSDYLGDKLTLEIKEETRCEISLPYIVKKDASSVPQRGLIKVTGRYSQSSSGRVMQIDSLVVNDITASFSSQDARTILSNLNVLVHKADSNLPADSLQLSWRDGSVSF